MFRTVTIINVLCFDDELKTKKFNEHEETQALEYRNTLQNQGHKVTVSKATIKFAA